MKALLLISVVLVTLLESEQYSFDWSAVRQIGNNFRANSGDAFQKIHEIHMDHLNKLRNDADAQKGLAELRKKAHEKAKSVRNSDHVKESIKKFHKEAASNSKKHHQKANESKEKHSQEINNKLKHTAEEAKDCGKKFEQKIDKYDDHIRNQLEKAKGHLAEVGRKAQH